MSKQKIITIIEGAIIIALGVLVAIFGPAPVLDTYVGIVSIVFGAALLIASIIGYAQTKLLGLPGLVLACVAISLGIGLLLNENGISLGFIFPILVYALLGLGVALIIYGAFLLGKKFLFTGIGQVVIGVLLVVFSLLYILVPDFRNAFWIIVGILIALYGVFFIISAFLVKKK